MLTEKETLFGSRPSPAKPAPLSSKKAERGPRISNIGGNGHNPASRRLSMGDAIMQPPATPELSRNGSTNSRNPASNGNGKEMKRERTKPAAPVSNVAIEKEITSTDGGSAPTSPRL